MQTKSSLPEDNAVILRRFPESWVSIGAMACLNPERRALYFLVAWRSFSRARKRQAEDCPNFSATNVAAPKWLNAPERTAFLG
jgi:hypothetical protein